MEENRQTIDTTEEDLFKPNKKQIAFLKAKLDPQVRPTIEEECKEAGINRQTYYNWLKKPGFLNWLRREFKKGMKDNMIYLDKLGMALAVKDFRYWEALQMKYSGYSKKIDKKVTSTSKVFLPGSKIVIE